MKNIIRKILKEAEDEFEWAHGLDINAAEKEVKFDFLNLDRQFGFEGDELYSMLIGAGITNISKLKEIGAHVHTEVESVWESGKDYGYDNADCTCEGCCDDYVYYEEADREKEEARDEGYQSGFESAKSESESEIEGLKSRIEELENRLNEG
jgi:hypothetical protein